MNYSKGTVRPADAGPLEREVKPLVKWRTGWRHDIGRLVNKRKEATWE